MKKPYAENVCGLCKLVGISMNNSYLGSKKNRGFAAFQNFIAKTSKSFYLTGQCLGTISETPPCFVLYFSEWLRTCNVAQV